MSAIARPPTAALRPGTAASASSKPRRPYSAYTKRGGDDSDRPKYDSEESNREWWRFYLKVLMYAGGSFTLNCQFQLW